MLAAGCRLGLTEATDVPPPSLRLSDPMSHTTDASPHDGPRAGAGAGMRVPDFFIVGQPKSGSTALYEMLKRHPQIHVPDRKEPRYFATELYERDAPRPGGTPKTLQEYLPWFAGAAAGQRVGDASPWYMWSRTAASLIAEVQPSARIIAIVRDPASL